MRSLPRTGKTALVRPTPALMDLLGSFKSKPMAGTGHGADERLEAIARKIAGMREKDVVEVRVMEGKETTLPHGRFLIQAEGSRRCPPTMIELRDSRSHGAI